jgi:hypothetical protein
MRRIVGKDKKGRTVLINVPSYDDMYINNQFGPQIALAFSSNGSGSASSSTPVVSGTQKAIFGYGYTSVVVSMTNLVSSTGVVATDTTGVGTARNALAAAGYGTDKAIFGSSNITNLVSNTGVVATDTNVVGTSRNCLAAAGYGTDKAIFGYGFAAGLFAVSMTNLVSNTGVE